MWAKSNRRETKTLNKAGLTGTNNSHCRRTEVLQEDHTHPGTPSAGRRPGGQTLPRAASDPSSHAAPLAASKVGQEVNK